VLGRRIDLEDPPLDWSFLADPFSSILHDIPYIIPQWITEESALGR
jgi:hypothetical protein